MTKVAPHVGESASRPVDRLSHAGGEGRVWTTTRLLADAGRVANQRIAVEALRLLRFVHQERFSRG